MKAQGKLENPDGSQGIIRWTPWSRQSEGHFLSGSLSFSVHC
jgi:hypothetical protein